MRLTADDRPHTERAARGRLGLRAEGNSAPRKDCALAFLMLVILSASTFGLSACRPKPVVPTVVPAHVTPLPPAVWTLPATSTVPPPTETAAGWVKHETATLIIWLPKSWELLQPGPENMQTLFANLAQKNPDLTAILGGPESLQTLSLWAQETTLHVFDARHPGPGFADNLNIRQTESHIQKAEDLQAVLDDIVAQYRRLGFDVGDIETGLQIGGLLAARIAYTFPMTGSDDRPMTLSGVQYLVAAGTDLWILSYTAGPGRAAELASVFERSALSFRVK